MTLLEAYQLPKGEVYLDIVRTPERFRVGRRGAPVGEGAVGSIQCNGREIFAIVRGSQSEEPWIFLDERTRMRLLVEAGKVYEFILKEADFCGKVRWALDASDVRNSFPARGALFSGLLGAISVALGIVSIVMAFHH